MSKAATPNILAAALEAYDAGLCVIRARTDGTKAPLGQWGQWQHQRPARTDIETWFAAGHPGLGVVCGNVSGDLEMFELEGRFMEAHGAEFLQRIKDAGIEMLFRRLINGYQMESPKGGRNFLYRVSGPVDGNTKLARDATHETLIETRGEGGFVVLAPSHGPTHPSGKPWRVREGSVANIPTISPDERETLFTIACSFDEAPATTTVTPPPATQRTAATAWQGGGVGDSWFDTTAQHLTATQDMQSVLERHGWTYCYTDTRGRRLMRRPGKNEGVSGSINENGRFCPFSTSVPFATAGGGKMAPTYDVLDVIATYEHGGDRNAAAHHHAETTGILDAWKSGHTPNLTLSPSQRRNVDPATGEIIETPPRNLPDTFWAARHELGNIRKAAHSRARSADAVLLFTLARIAATIPPAIRLPPIVGGAASLNFLGAVIGTSGSGKSTAGDVARELAPINRTDVVADLPLGSGEGLAEQYFEWVSEEQPDGKKKLVKRQTKKALYMYLDEGQALGEMGNRKGATLLPTLRSAWSGATIGNANASADTRRVVPAHSYRLALMVGFQAEHAIGLIDDTAGGTPQRFVFASAVDPTIPETQPPWPGQLDMTPPVIVSNEQYIDVAEEIRNEIHTHSVMATRGQITINPLDSHRNLVRLKVAALLGYLDGRSDVNIEDWELAGAVMDTSQAVREWVIETARLKARADEMAGHKKAARREEVVANAITDGALRRAAQSVGRRARRVDILSLRDIAQAISGRDRKVVTIDEVIEEAIRMQWITPVETGDRWRRGEAQPT